MSDGFTVTIETPKIHLGGFFSRFWAIVASMKSPVETEIKSLLQNTARGDHRYTVQTGQLRSSTKARGSFNPSDQITLLIDRTQVDYAEYVVNGSGSWTGDPFIDKALETNLPRITAMIAELYNRATEEFNNLP